MYLFLYGLSVLVCQNASLAILNSLEFVLVDQLGVLPIKHLPLLALLQVFKGIGFLSSLALHQEHSSLLSLLQLFSHSFFLLLLLLLLFLLLSLVFNQWPLLGLLKSLLLHLHLCLLLLALLLLLLGQRLSCSHNRVFLLADCRFKLVFFFVILLPSFLLLLSSFFFHLVQFGPQLLKSHLIKQANTEILYLLFGLSPNLLLQLFNLLYQLFFL